VYCPLPHPTLAVLHAEPLAGKMALHITRTQGCWLRPAWSLTMIEWNQTCVAYRLQAMYCIAWDCDLCLCVYYLRYTGRILILKRDSFQRADISDLWTVWRKNASAAISDRDGLLALHHAVLRNNLQIVEILLSYTAALMVSVWHCLGFSLHNTFINVNDLGLLFLFCSLQKTLYVLHQSIDCFRMPTGR